jgi:general stress protein YciG
MSDEKKRARGVRVSEPGYFADGAELKRALADVPPSPPGAFVHVSVPQPPMSVREAGRLGGRKTKAKHGPAFFEEIGRLGGIATQRKHAEAQRVAEEARKAEKP